MRVVVIMIPIIRTLHPYLCNTLSQIYMVMIMNGINGHDNLSIVFNMHDRLLWKNDV